MADGKTSKLIGAVVAVGGGAGAAYLDTKFSDKRIAGQGPGAIAAIAGLALGLFKGGKIGHLALELGTGAAAFEAGKMVVGAVSSPAVSGYRGVRGMHGVRGVPAMNPGYRRPATADEFERHLQAVARVA